MKNTEGEGGGVEKANVSINLNLGGGGGGGGQLILKIPSMGGVWIYSRTTHLVV